MALQTKTFSYGSLAYQSATKGYILELTLTEQSADPATNSSRVDYVLRLRSGSNNRFSSYGLGAAVTLDGRVVATRERYTAPQVSLGYNSSVTLLSGTTDVAHDPDGSKKMTVAFSIDMATGSYVPGPVSVTGEVMQLTAIPRASAVGAVDAAIGANTVITVKQNDKSFTHTIGWTFGELSGYIGADWQVSDTPVRLTDTGISFSVPTSFYSQIPAAKSGECTLTVTTYSDSTQIGEPQTARFTARAEESLCTPDLVGTVEDINEATLALTKDAKRLVKFFSTARCAVTATAKNGAAISEKQIGGVVTKENTLDLPNVETAEIGFAVTDSRGFSASYTDKGLVLVPYVRLTSNPRIRRTDPTSGAAELTFSGDWYSGSFGATDNALSLSCSVDGGPEQTFQATTDGDSYTAVVTLQGLAYQQSHTVAVTVRDKLDTVVKTLSVGKGIPVFDWGEQDFQFHVPVTVPKLLLGEQEAATKAYADTLFAGVPFAWRGICADADTAGQTGVYRLNDTSTNSPNTNGMLLVFRCGADAVSAPVWQVAMDYSGGNRKCRMIWYGSAPTAWTDL